MTEYALVDPTIHPPAQLNGKGQCQCCIRKPIVYKHDSRLFCGHCDRSFDLVTGEQIPNWAWARIGDGFQSTKTRKVTP